MLLNTGDCLKILEKRRESVMKFGLHRVGKLAASLQLLHWDCPVILVGGTNGKGSTVRALETLYHAAGYTTASYTSPHLLSFHERIRYNLHPIDDFSLSQAFSAIYQAETEPLTYFEFATLAALWFFRQKNPDILILEVGLGGRLDATNIIDADIAIITTIDFDHEAYLGNTLEAIGLEKAGIFRKGQQAILATERMPKSIAKVAAEKGTHLYRYGQDYYHTVNTEYIWQSEAWTWRGALPQLSPSAVSAALMASRLLNKKLPVSAQAYDAVMQATLEGRLQVFPGEVEVVCDVSHNRESVSRLVHFLERYTKRRVHAVFSALQDKPIQEMVAMVAPCIHSWHVAPLKGERAASITALHDAFQNRNVLWYDDLISAFDAARRGSFTQDVIVVFGSFLTVSAVLPYLQD